MARYGTTIYTVSEKASDKMAEDVANAENKSDVLAGLDMTGGDTDQVKDILFDLTRQKRGTSGRFRPQPRQGAEVLGSAVQGAAPAGELQGVEGGGRALGNGGARLHVER